MSPGASSEEAACSREHPHLPDTLTPDYCGYARSFLRFGTPDVRAVVQGASDAQLQLPEPIVQLNLSYRPSAYVRDLITDGTQRETTGLALN